MANDWVDPKAAAVELIRAGIPEISYALSILLGEDSRGTQRSNLEFFKEAIRDLGPQLVCELAQRFTHVKMPKNLMAQGLPAQAMAVLKAFRKPLKALLDNKGLNEKGYRLYLNTMAGDPLPFAIHLIKRNRAGEYSLGMSPTHLKFGLFIDGKGRPGAIFGSMQGNRQGKEGLAAFQEAVGTNALAFFADRFKRAFPPSRLFALNPRFHEYQHPAWGVVLRQLSEDGKYTESEAYEYFLARTHANIHGEQVFHPRFPVALAGMANIDMEAARKVHPLVEEEIRRIRTNATGMHLAAYRKAGFRGTKGQKRWRLPPQRRTRK